MSCSVATFLVATPGSAPAAAFLPLVACGATAATEMYNGMFCGACAVIDARPAAEYARSTALLAVNAPPPLQPLAMTTPGEGGSSCSSSSGDLAQLPPKIPHVEGGMCMVPPLLPPPGAPAAGSEVPPPPLPTSASSDSCGGGPVGGAGGGGSDGSSSSSKSAGGHTPVLLAPCADGSPGHVLLKYRDVFVLGGEGDDGEAWARRVAVWASGAVPPPRAVRVIPFREFNARYPFALSGVYGRGSVVQLPNEILSAPPGGPDARLWLGNVRVAMDEG
jgi:hypothetical protein